MVSFSILFILPSLFFFFFFWSKMQTTSFHQTVYCMIWKILHVLNLVAEPSLHNSSAVWCLKLVNNYNYKDCCRLCQISSLLTKLSTDTSKLGAVTGVSITEAFINKLDKENTITKALIRDWQHVKNKLKLLKSFQNSQSSHIKCCSLYQGLLFSACSWVHWMCVALYILLVRKEILCWRQRYFFFFF